MSSVPLYKAFIEAGVSEQSATKAVEDVIQVSQLPQLATKTDLLAVKTDLLAVKTEIANLRTDMAERETRLIKWMVGCGFLFAGINLAGVGILIQIL